jgi:hypothetical protein
MTKSPLESEEMLEHTRRSLAEKALRVSDEQQALLLKLSDVGYAAIDPDAETLHVSKDWNAPGVESLAGVLLLRDYGSFIDSLKRGEFIAILDVRKDDEPPSPPRRWKAAARVRLSMCR